MEVQQEMLRKALREKGEVRKSCVGLGRARSEASNNLTEWWSSFSSEGCLG